MVSWQQHHRRRLALFAGRFRNLTALYRFVGLRFIDRFDAARGQLACLMAQSGNRLVARAATATDKTPTRFDDKLLGNHFTVYLPGIRDFQSIAFERTLSVAADQHRPAVHRAFEMAARADRDIVGRRDAAL